MPLGIYHDPEIWFGTWNPEESSEKTSFEQRIAQREFDPIEISISRGGLFVFDFSKWQHTNRFGGGDFLERRSQQIEFINTYLLCFYSAVATRGLIFQHTRYVIPVMRARVRNVLGIFDDGYASANLSSDLSRMATRWSLARRSYHVPPTHVIPERALSISFDIFSELWQKRDARTFTLADLLLGALEAHFDLRFAEALGLAWLITETLLDDVWVEYVNRNRVRKGTPFINIDRKEKLTEGYDYTASIRIEILSLLDEISYVFYNQLTTARKARNDWIHELKPVTFEQSSIAIDVAERLFRDKYSFNTTLPPRIPGIIGGGAYRDETKPPDRPIRDVEYKKKAVHVGGLDKELRNALKSHTTGISYSSPTLRLHLLADTPAEDEEIARAIIDAHDPAFLRIDDEHKTLPGEYKFDGPRLQPHIAGNGSDEAVVTIRLPNTNKSQVVLVCEEVEEAIDLSNGIGYYKITSSAPPGTILRAHVKDHPGDPLKIEVIES